MTSTIFRPSGRPRSCSTFRGVDLLVACIVAMAACGPLQAADSPKETFRAVPMPPGVRVEATELDGPVFADPAGKTLYRWPLRQLRNGPAGDRAGSSECTDVPSKVSAGLMSPYPAGLKLPDADRRLSCVQMWPPFLADADARAIGKWSIIKRQEGSLQWAYEGLPVYTSYLDQRPGDVFGGRADKRGGDTPAMRQPIGPPPDVPPGFAVKTMSTGRLLVTDKGASVYASDRDTPEKSNCDATCADTWIPLLGPAYAVVPQGSARSEWTLIERSPGIKQWAFRGQPLYQYRLDSLANGFKGSDVPGWHNVYTQRAPSPPPEFTVQDTTAGQVLADRHGKTIYTYFCGDDSQDQLGCDHPQQEQAYRLAVCGGGDAERCLQSFPYVPAAQDAKSVSRSWSVMIIDPQTGRRVDAQHPGALRVWAYRDRPIYTYAGDRRPGDTFANGHGEFRGQRNGFRAFWLRDDFFNQDQPGPG